MLGIIAIIIAIAALVVALRAPKVDSEKIEEAVLAELEARLDSPVTRDEVANQIDNLRDEMLAAIDASNEGELHIEG